MPSHPIIEQGNEAGNLGGKNLLSEARLSLLNIALCPQRTYRLLGTIQPPQLSHIS